ncbi:MAG: class I poly(R)-hydroxyalkanoic acid synthase [Alphaproteobacteria bacterium]|nr:class I poly(R)-hydroxyalkanoic acid synthase [Alphaproteobacteria bacterium]
MPSEKVTPERNIEVLNKNLERIEVLTQRLVASLAQQREKNQALEGPGQELYMKAAAAYLSEMMTNPSKILEQQVSYWGKSLRHLAAAQESLAAGEVVPEDQSAPDRRFKNEMWNSHPYFNFIKQQYLMSSEAIGHAIEGLDHLDATDKRRVDFFARQIVDLMSPANFLGSNPEALEKALATNGQSLVDGLENLVRDVEANDGALAVTLSDPNAFEVGKNIATSKGSVVFQNRMFQLIQYAPTTEKVHKIPLIIFPPWINKFYILDLKEKNSLIKWATAQGYTLFVVSWVNPDASYADVGIDTYVTEGFLTAISEVKKITNQPQVNAVGYCIAGTMLSVTLAYMAKIGDKSIRSATFFTALADFSDPGETGVFLEADFLDGIEAEVASKGYLHRFFMQRTFSYLRANDLVYGPAIKSYMMGEAPPAFDLLYWNGDGTNLSGRLVIEYLRKFCFNNELSKGEFTLLGKTLSLKDVKTPTCAIACETDHIAKWQGSFAGLNQFRGPKTFILSESGHIAGIVNPPNRDKYGHYTNDAKMVSPDAWKDGAKFNKGSWWPNWESWLSRRSGAMVMARIPGDASHPVIESAPGSYIKHHPTD